MPRIKKTAAQIRKGNKTIKTERKKAKVEDTRTRSEIMADLRKTEFQPQPEFIKPYSILNENNGRKISVVDNTGRAIAIFESADIKANQIKAEEKYNEIK